jgi:hypothetical protein
LCPQPGECSGAWHSKELPTREANCSETGLWTPLALLVTPGNTFDWLRRRDQWVAPFQAQLDVARELLCDGVPERQPVLPHPVASCQPRQGQLCHPNDAVQGAVTPVVIKDHHLQAACAEDRIQIPAPYCTTGGVCLFKYSTVAHTQSSSCSSCRQGCRLEGYAIT